MEWETNNVLIAQYTIVRLLHLEALVNFLIETMVDTDFPVDFLFVEEKMHPRLQKAVMKNHESACHSFLYGYIQLPNELKKPSFAYRSFGSTNDSHDCVRDRIIVGEGLVK